MAAVRSSKTSFLYLQNVIFALCISHNFGARRYRRVNRKLNRTSRSIDRTSHPLSITGSSRPSHAMETCARPNLPVSCWKGAGRQDVNEMPSHHRMKKAVSSLLQLHSFLAQPKDGADRLPSPLKRPMGQIHGVKRRRDTNLVRCV